MYSNSSARPEPPSTPSLGRSSPAEVRGGPTSDLAAWLDAVRAEVLPRVHAPLLTSLRVEVLWEAERFCIASWGVGPFWHAEIFSLFNIDDRPNPFVMAASIGSTRAEALLDAVAEAEEDGGWDDGELTIHLEDHHLEGLPKSDAPGLRLPRTYRCSTCGHVVVLSRPEETAELLGRLQADRDEHFTAQEQRELFQPLPEVQRRPPHVCLACTGRYAALDEGGS